MTDAATDKIHYLGGFVDWDNTSRRANNGLVCTGVTPSKFGKYLKKLLAVAEEKESPYIFLNAWNEWAEGPYLEPDKANGYGYLNAIKDALSFENGEKHD